MSSLKYIEKLLDGANIKLIKLGDIVKFKRGTSISRKDIIHGKIPVIAGGKKPAYFHNINNRDGETIVIASSGSAGFVSWWNKPVFVSDSFTVHPDKKLMLPKYCFYVLKNMQSSLYNLKMGTGIQHVYPKNVSTLLIPIPCPQDPEKSLKIQSEIVRILDKFSELTAELTARKKQYKYYREQLYLFKEKDIQCLPMGEIGKFTRGTSLQKKHFQESGIECIHYGQIYTYYNTFTDSTKSFVSQEFAQKARKAKYGSLIIATTSENDEDICKSVAWLGSKDVVVSNDACFYEHNLNPKYVAYFLQTDIFQKQKIKYITGTKVRRVNPNNLAKILIPIPSKEEQNRIVKILDRFNTLCSDISDGLPSEIKARQQQYEYYRNKLLTFAE